MFPFHGASDEAHSAIGAMFRPAADSTATDHNAQIVPGGYHHSSSILLSTSKPPPTLATSIPNTTDWCTTPAGSVDSGHTKMKTAQNGSKWSKS